MHMPALTRRDLLGGTAASALAFGLGARPAFADAPLKPILLAEPAHLFAYVPVYLAIDGGLFARHGLNVSTLVAANGAHVTALVSGQVWGNIGGAESDAMADNGIADPLIAICNIINRALVYFVARKGLVPKSMSPADMKAFLKGKKFALSRYGGTPDVLARTYMEQNGIDLKNDVTIVNNASIASAPDLVKSGAVDIAIATEPQVSFGVAENIWEEPFYSFPSLGDYAFTCVSTKKSTITGDPATVQAFVTALVDALHMTVNNRPAVESTLAKDFPNITPAVSKAALDRCYRDQLWSKDGVITVPAYEKDMASVYSSGEMTRRVPLAQVADMSFVNYANRHR